MPETTDQPPKPVRPDLFGPDARGRMSSRLTLPLPPSDNALYWNGPGGSRILTSTGKRYKRAVRDLVSAVIAKAGSPADFITDVPYEIILNLYFTEIEKKTWGQKRGAKTRYKKIDAGNHQKLVIDAVMSAIGVDDCHIMREVIRKRCDKENPRVVAIVREVDAMGTDR